MQSDNFKYLEQKSSTSTKKVLGWIAYVFVAIVVSLLVLMTLTFWPFFVTVISFIFGPKLWRNVR